MFHEASVNDSQSNFYLYCQKSIPSMALYSLYTLVSVFCLFPLSLFIFNMGFRKWLRQRSTSPGKAFTHADVLTYHSVAVQLICVFGAFFYCVGAYSWNLTLTMVGVFFTCISLPTEPLFEMLVCVDLFLAVMFPIQYTLHRDKSGATIRDVCIAVVWLCGFCWVGVTKHYMPRFATVPFNAMTVICLGVIMLCGVSVVCVLRRSGPVEEGGSKRRVDQRKLRALQIIMSITGVLLLRNFSYVLVTSMETRMEDVVFCALMDFAILFTIPSSLVLPCLFLHRERKLKFCHKTKEQEVKVRR